MTAIRAMQQSELAGSTVRPAYTVRPVYLDANASVRPLEEVVELVCAAMREGYANAASAHWLGGTSRAYLEEARDGVASLIPGALPEGVIFTSGGTEGNNTLLAINGSRDERGTLVTTAAEHLSVLRSTEAFARCGGRVVMLPVSRHGLVDPQDLRAAVTSAKGPVTVSIQWANSETGVVQPVEKLVAETKSSRPDAFIHSDVAQAIGRVPVSLQNVDAVTFSGHKLHGPQGTGAIVLRDPYSRLVTPLIVGGGQERGLRSGTANVAGAAGLGLAAKLRASDFASLTAHLEAMRDAFEREVIGRLPTAQVNGSGAPRVPNTSNIRFGGIEAMELIAKLDAKAIACSAGSACSAAKPEPSHVLTAMGLAEEQAFSSVRFSFSVLNSMQEAAAAAAAVAETVGEMS